MQPAQIYTINIICVRVSFVFRTLLPVLVMGRESALVKGQHAVTLPCVPLGGLADLLRLLQQWGTSPCSSPTPRAAGRKGKGCENPLETASLRDARAAVKVFILQ